MSQHVAVIMGGPSVEREVSLVSGGAVERTLNRYISRRITIVHFVVVEDVAQRVNVRVRDTVWSDGKIVSTIRQRD